MKTTVPKKEEQLGAYGVNWSKIDLSSPYETSLPLVDEYTFDGLLLEISCNLREINEKTVMAQFEEALQSRVTSARDIMRDNIKSIVAHANAQREEA